jgi:hypothetical protein
MPGPFKAKTRVRIPLGTLPNTPIFTGSKYGAFRHIPQEPEPKKLAESWQSAGNVFPQQLQSQIRPTGSTDRAASQKGQEGGTAGGGGTYSSRNVTTKCMVRLVSFMARRNAR